MAAITVKTWDGKNSLTLEDTCFILRWLKEEKVIPIQQVVSFEVKPPKGKLRPGMITLRLAGTASPADRIVAAIYSTGANSIGFPHGFSYLEAGNDMQRRFAELQGLISEPNQQLSSADEIKKFKELLDMGAITEAEYNQKKKELLLK